MIYITEKKNSNGIYYERRFEPTLEAEAIIDIIQIKTATTIVNNINYTYLYDSNMEPISPVFEYLNFELKNSSPNNLTPAISALKLLFCFLELFHTQFHAMKKNDLKKLILFLEGIPKKGVNYQLNLTTQRSHSTINNYFSVYRSYANFLGLTDSIFTKKGDFKKHVYIPESETVMKVPTYEVRLKTYKPEISTPRYISVEEFKSILKVIREEYTLREECIVRLMFEGGLRIGEVLGLTNEDIVENNGNIYLHIRNRCTDAPYQLAKTCMHVSHPNQYHSKAYRQKDVGYQVAVISLELLDKINNYVNAAHIPSSTLFERNYAKHTICDNVLGSNDENFYLFINNLGKPLSANLWNKTLRTIFKKAGLNVDKLHRENNLNHRFRHGFAMFMVKYKHIKTFDLSLLMRHRSLSSVQHYYRPTDEDIVELKTEFVKSIYEIIPELSI